MNKRFLPALILSTVLAATLVGCGSESSVKDITTDAVQDALSGSDTDEAAGSDGSEDAADGATDENSDASADDSDIASEDSSASDVSVTIDEQILVDQDGIKITATEYTTDGFLGDGIKLLIENNSEQDYTISCDALIVNDFMISDLFAADVAAGKKSNETLDLYSYELEAAGIDTVGKIEVYFRAYDSDWNDLFEDVYAEIDTSEYADMDTTIDDTGAELYNEGGIRIVGKTVDEDSFWGMSILLYVENTSGQNIAVSVDDLSINGFMMTPYFSSTVYDGKKSVDSMTLMSSELEENDITSIEDVELKFHIYNADTYDTIVDTDPITFTAQ